MDSLEFVNTGIRVCEDHKALDLKAYDLRENSVLMDFCIIGCGNSVTHIRALSQHLNKSFKNIGILPRNIEGTPESEWILMDYGDILIHLFLDDLRRHYDIENLFENDILIYPKNELI